MLRKTQQLSRHDDAEFLDLEKDNENIAKEAAQQNSINAAAGSDTGGSLGQTRAFPPGGHRRTFSRPPPGGGQEQPPPGGGPPPPPPPPAQPPAAGGMPRLNIDGGHGQQPHAPLQTHSTTGGPPHPPSNGAKIMTGRTQRKPAQQFDLTIHDHMHDAGDDTAKVLAEHEHVAAQKKRDR